jgi:uncharacterized protein YciI
MKKIYLLIVLLPVSCLLLHAQLPNKKILPATHQNKEKLENKVRQYFFVMLTRGKNRNHDSATAAAIQEGHMANINKLYYEGKLKVAGPFGDEGNWLGIFIFDCNTKEEVEALLKTDPAIAAGRLAYEIHPWWTAEMGSFTRGIPKKS